MNIPDTTIIPACNILTDHRLGNCIVHLSAREREDT
ncbi:hypothetical protein CABS01_17125 [Colletotrichum abscissum]|nr:uncharacterized protein CABS01_17125 [Colletotrichum abscissum]KAK1490919.1 hypothetical protein CABS01_17125 [Colletotrichum abscissum]